MCVCGMLHPALDRDPQHCQTRAPGERTVQGAGLHSRPGACTRGLFRTFAQPQDAQEFCTPLGCIQVSPSLEGGPCEGLQVPPAAQRVCAHEGARLPSKHPGIPEAKLASQTWVGSGSDRTEGMASGVIFPWSLGVCRDPWNFFRFSILRRSGLLCPVKVLHLPALCRGGKTNRQNLHLLTENI